MSASRPISNDPAPAGLCIPGHLHPLSFIERLSWRLEHDPPRQKSARTRERLKLAAARFLDREGVHELKAGSVSKEAGLAEGSFYLYFSDKHDIARTVLTEFQQMFFGLQTGVDARPGETAFDAIRLANRIWIAYARANAGLLRCLYQFADGDTDFASELQEQNLRWHTRVMRATLRQRGGPVTEDAALFLLVNLLGGMMDDLARKLIVYPDRNLLGLLEQMGSDDTALADACSLIWYRLLYPFDIAPGELPQPADAVARHLFPVPA